MPDLVPVEDPADPRLRDYLHLREVELRKSLEAEHGLFVAEGEKVIRRAVGAGYPIRSVLTTPRWLPGLADVVGDARVYLVSPEVMEGIAGFSVHRGALASMARRALPDVRTLLDEGPRRVVVLEDLVDHGNVGAVFRCAAALGVDAVVLSPRCADPLYRRSIKVSMGAVFAVPYARMTDWHHGLGELRATGFQTLALTPDQTAAPLDEVAMGERVALLLGSEGDGLSSRWLRAADQAVCIPMSPRAMDLGVDSLNVVAAAAIACHGLVGQVGERRDSR
ncbi:RNA methyltransferase [Sphaerisporangium sp. B11E5]|uniref:TrmH family RNA methyltransferase n=1 Tax=Sphaerisporangium sp. B11E5 TaxID=3153563 RepID=UPI00325C5D5F